MNPIIAPLLQSIGNLLQALAVAGIAALLLTLAAVEIVLWLREREGL